MDLATKYDAQAVEAKWYQLWEEGGLFQPRGNGLAFTITIPPPNITGALHMGHSLCYPLQDAIGRFKRLQGFNVQVIPGQDHAGIATQSVVTKQLAAQGIKATEIGREEFIKRTWEWRRESGDTILNQFRALGCAFDWTESRFTLDEEYVEAVLSVFVQWFERGIIYRGKRIVNWDPVLRTSVSDIETERKVIKGKLYHFRYPFVDGSGHVVIATTRPETMLGDVAVAVHPADSRYASRLGKTLRLPLVGREIPLLADPYPDPEFGSGAVKVTPAHDPNDYEIGQRHGLQQVIVLDERAKVCAPGPYEGLDRYEARKRIVADLEALDLVEKIEDYDIPVMVSDRSKEIIEPLLSEQWFVRQSELARPAMDAVQDGRIQFMPERFAKVYLDWLEGIRDWCISRQLWWGHRIPVFYSEDGEAFAALTWQDAQVKAGDGKIVRQDEDVLDTWFSSGLWPFAVQGWPQSKPSLGERYPTNVLVTDRNIIYLWVARMAMMGLDLIGEVPFKQVCIHATVMNEQGQRMSKSLGTGVDPTDVIQRVGADALRYTLLSQAGSNQEIRYSERRTEDARNLCNKLWNASRFVLLNLDEALERPDSLAPIEAWLLSRLADTEQAVRDAYEQYDFQSACHSLYRFFWSEYCDWFIETSKTRMEEASTKWVLSTALEAVLKMLHPIMPHITEELYSYLPHYGKAPFLMVSDWPALPSDFRQPEIESQVTRWFDLVRAVRALRADLELDPRKPIPVAYFEGHLQGGEAVLLSQAWISELKPGRAEGRKLFSTSVGGVEVHLPLDESIDLQRLIAKTQSEASKIAQELEKIETRLQNPDFVGKAKPELVATERERSADLRDRLQRAFARQATLEGVAPSRTP